MWQGVVGQVFAAGDGAAQRLGLLEVLGVQNGAQAGRGGTIAVQEALVAATQVLVARQTRALLCVGATVARALTAMAPVGVRDRERSQRWRLKSCCAWYVC